MARMTRMTTADRMTRMTRIALTAIVVAAAPVASAVAADEFVRQYCVSCHGGARGAGGLTLATFSRETAAEDAERSERVIRKLRAGLMPPPGSPMPPAAAALEYAQALEIAIDAAARSTAHVRPRPFQRLNRAEYRHAIRDLLDLDVDVSPLLPDDPVSGGFDTIAAAQTASPLLITGYLRAAHQISTTALSHPRSRQRILVCSPRTKADEAPCAARIIQQLTERAYRGFATADDRRDALSFYSRGRAQGHDAGIRLALESILVSPRFVFRLEDQTAGVEAAQNPALANRLSFFLWSSPPDAELLAAARRGRLSSRTSLRQQLSRMIADPRSAALATRFGAQWLRLQDLETVAPDATRFPSFDAALAADMRAETELVLEDVIRRDRSILDLLALDYSFLNERLARHYGIEGVTGPEFRRVPMPAERRGVLGHGSVLASTSLADRTSPVLRGKWIMEVLLGTPPPPPPPNVPALDDSAAPFQNGRALTTRERFEQHRRNPACSSCHRVIDPLGMALEHFDAVGAWRDRENDGPVDASAQIYDGTRVTGAPDLREALVMRRDLILQTFAEGLLRYATGRLTDYRDMPVVRSIVAQASRDNYRFSAFLRGVVESAAFRMPATDP
jgi:mono/diheme cytochrome c family protein